jgi:S-adenosylmethionine:tRNA ribosyltransferase-isomerase
MKLTDFNYHLPQELIAQYPLPKRDEARLLVLDRKDGSIRHHIFREVVNYLRADDLLILNNTKVVPARLEGRRLTGGRVELLLLKRKSGATFAALIKPSRINIGEKIKFNGSEITCQRTAKDEVAFSDWDEHALYQLGKMPLPPYIKRAPQEKDNLYYQTVYARQKGSIAAPTAGLHFTKALLRKIASRGVNIAEITLHIGYATFKPVTEEDITRHRMEPEYFHIDKGACAQIEKARLKKARLIAVGTSSLRALEASVSGLNQGDTDLFVYPGYKFESVDCLLTNFHLPRTTLFMLVCAFAGTDLIKKAYSEAIAQNYRFYSYGDAMLIL